jgi:signal transduction histidine kinase
MRAAALLLFLVALLPAASTAQSSLTDQTSFSRGLPHPVMHYDPDDTPADRQVWDIVQDSSRIVYIAGSRGGVQMFDGEHWYTVPIDTTDAGDGIGTARSVAKGHDGRIYVGTNDDLGVLEPNAIGQLCFQSLLKHLPEQEQEADADGTGTVWFAGSTSAATFFQTQRALYRWDGQSLDVWRMGDTFLHTTHIVDDRVFVRDFKRGLLELVGSTLRPVSGGEAFANRAVHAMILHPSGAMLAITGTEGAYLISEEGATPASVEADSVLTTTRVYAGTPIRGAEQPLYALATLGRGVLIIDLAGNIRYHLRPGMELPDGVVNTVYQGLEGELWIGFNNEGVMRIGGLPSVEYYGERSGLRGQIQAISIQNDALYVGTGSGLYRMQERSPQDRALQDTPFERIPRSAVINHLVATDAGLVVDDLTRVWFLDNDDFDRTLISRNADFPYAPPSFPGTIVVPHMRGGVSLVQRGAGGWTRRRFDDVGPAIHSMIEYEGELWAAADPRTVMRFPMDGSIDFSTTRFMELMPRVGRAGFRFLKIRNQLAILSRSGIYLWNREGRAFEEAPEWMPPDVGPLRSYIYRTLGDQSHLWAVQGGRLYHATFAAGTRVRSANAGDSLSWEAVPGLSFRENESVRLYAAENGDLWIGRGDDLLRHRPEQQRALADAPQVQIRRVMVGMEQQVVRGGSRTSIDVLSLPYSSNAPTITFSAPNFSAESPAVYRTYLKGRDASPGDWMPKPRVEYPGLSEGRYTLQVEAKTVDGVVSSPATVTFSIAPPWYRTTWAYLAYLVGLLGVGVAVWRYRVAVRGRVQAERQTSRTEEQLEAEQQLTRSLKRANERLRELSRMKEYFIANTSHELRTPLTNIIGFARVLQEDVSSNLRPQLEVIEKNGYRLLNTLNAILDLAALRSGTMRPVLAWTDVRPPIRTVVGEMRSEAEQKGIHLRLDMPDKPLYAYVDVHVVERITRHLVDNAVKFTEEGSVEVQVSGEDKTIEITITDTGIGIDPSFIPNLFMGFEQESRGRARSHEGSGVGLTVASQFVNVLNGKILVESTKGEGSSFRVILPRQADRSTSVEQPVMMEQGGSSIVSSIDSGPLAISSKKSS